VVAGGYARRKVDSGHDNKINWFVSESVSLPELFAPACAPR
jgi:hypothetical protein